MSEFESPRRTKDQHKRKAPEVKSGATNKEAGNVPTTDTISRPPIHSVLGEDSPRARRTDPLTSHEAADSSNVITPRLWVLMTLTEHGPLADHEIENRSIREALTYTPQRLRTARAELVEMGMVEATGKFRKTRTGHDANVWAAVK